MHLCHCSFPSVECKQCATANAVTYCHSAVVTSAACKKETRTRALQLASQFVSPCFDVSLFVASFSAHVH